jgi:HSP20 family protein
MRMVTPYWTSRSLASDLWNELGNEIGQWMQTPAAYSEDRFDPATEFVESDDHFLMSVDLPGMKKENIKIEVNDQMITLSGERKREVESDKKYRFQRYEKTYGFFKHTYTLPSSVQTDQIDARYENGVLELYLPKKVTAQPRKVEIRTGQEGFFGKLLGGKKSASAANEMSTSSEKAS